MRYVCRTKKAGIQKNRGILLLTFRDIANQYLETKLGHELLLLLYFTQQALLHI